MNSRTVRRLSTLLGRLHFQHVRIVDSQGQVERLVAPDADLKARSFPVSLLEQLQAGRVWEVLPSPAGEPRIYLFQPLSEARYTVGALHTAYFVELQSAITFGQKDHAAVVDRRGRVIAYPNPQWRTTVRDISHLEPVRRMMDGETGVQRFSSPALQKEVIAGFSTVPGVRWGVMIPQPLSELEAHVGRVQRAVWLVIGVALLCSTALGMCVSRWLATPLRRIGAVAERFAHGAYDARVRAPGLCHTREAATLAAQFNRMADDVNRSWQEARASEQRFRAFAPIAADWFWETDLHQVFTYISPPSDTGHRQAFAAAVGHHRGAYVYGDPEGTVVARIQSCMDRGTPFDEVEYQLLGSDGQPMHVSVSGRPIYDAHGVLVGYRGITRDITARLYTEEQLRQAQQDVQRRQAQKMEAIGVLAGGIAHDFNNILSAILGYTDLALHESAPDSPMARYLQEVLTAGRRAQSLVRQILTFSRASAPERIPVQLHPLIKEALNLLRASLPTTIDIRQYIDRDVGQCWQIPRKCIRC